MKELGGRGQEAGGRGQGAGGRGQGAAEYNFCIIKISLLQAMSYKEQFIWQRAVDLSVQCYQVTKHFPKEELYGLTSQIRRCSVSIASNIAEGYGRRTKNEFIHFLHISLGSLRELDTQLTIAKKVELTEDKLLDPLLRNTDRMQGILVATLQKLKKH